MGKASFAQADYLEALVKAYQYLAGLISDREVWTELEKVLTYYFQADLVAFQGRRPDGEIVLLHCTPLEEASGGQVLRQTAATVAEVLESGFLATEVVNLPEPYAVALFPISEGKQTTRVMLVGHRRTEPLPRSLLDIYLALAGLCGATLERLSSERRIQRMTEKVPEMLFELLVYPDGALRFTYVSRQSNAIFSQPPEALLNNAEIVLNALHPEDRAGFQAALTGRVTEGTHLSREVRCFAPDGRGSYLLFHARSSLQEDWVVWDGFFLDISERKQAEEEIRRLNEGLELRVKERTAQLEAANKELESFSYSVSHDLRAPVRAISGFSRILLEDHAHCLEDEGRRLLQIIIADSRRMGRLIDDLLAFSRLGRGDLSLSEVDMNRLVNQVVGELEKASAGRSLRWQVLPLPMVQADRSLLHQVWLNLLGNAVKFTTSVEAVVIEVGCRQEEDREVFYVKDNGVGFDMRYANKLFQVFERLHGPQEFEGTGIGLALAQRIISRHGGTIWAEGKVNGGATFFFTLPPPAGPKKNRAVFVPVN
ncbi:MAG: ATP-binding protein [Desulfobaccales bacterium]|jgi:signal transduction histidine kinase